MEFIINCDNLSEKHRKELRTNALLDFCKLVDIVCYKDDRHPGDCIADVSSADPYHEVLKMNALLSFCSLHKYPMMRMPDNPFEEFLHYYKKK